MQRIRHHLHLHKVDSNYSEFSSFSPGSIYLQMPYIEFTPCPALASDVKCYWIFIHDKNNGNHTERIIPDGHIDFVYHFGEVPRLVIDGKEITKPCRFLGGHLISPVSLRFGGQLKSFGIRFFPWVSARLYSMNAHELNNRRIPVSEIFGRSFTQKENLLMNELNAGNYSFVISVIEKELLARMSKKTMAGDLLESSIKKIMRSKGNISLHQLAEGAGVSERYLQKIFKLRKGMPVKYFCRLARVQHSISLIKQKKEASFTSLSYECGYFDQSHFIRDFKQFTGLAPTDFFAEDHLYINEINDPAHSSFFYNPV